MRGDTTLKFGQFKERTVEEVYALSSRYLKWVANCIDFTPPPCQPDIQQIIQEYLNEKEPGWDTPKEKKKKHWDGFGKEIQRHQKTVQGKTIPIISARKLENTTGTDELLDMLNATQDANEQFRIKRRLRELCVEAEIKGEDG